MLRARSRAPQVPKRLLSAAAARPLGAVAGEPARRVQYESHVPTTPAQKLLLSVASALSVFANPERGDMLAALGEVTGASTCDSDSGRSDGLQDKKITRQRLDVVRQAAMRCGRSTRACAPTRWARAS